MLKAILAELKTDPPRSGIVFCRCELSSIPGVLFLGRATPVTSRFLNRTDIGYLLLRERPTIIDHWLRIPND